MPRTAMYDIDYYKQINQEEAEQAARLGDLLTWIYAPQSVLDVGSATGLYLKPFLNKGIQVTGVDYATAAVDDTVLQIPKQYITTRDITKKPIGVHADLALCIEVLEHIDAKDAAVSIHHLAECADTILFTAAQPGQGGTGHINCQLKDYWDSLFQTEGFRRDEQDEAYIKIIMASGYHMGWLLNNLMVFKRRV
jgi:SAM-dependent methyltransferase